MENVIDTLQKLQQEDREILSLHSALDVLQASLKECNDAIAVKENEKETLSKSSQYKAARANIDEGAFKEHEDDINELKEQLKNSSNLKEYHNLNAQISAKNFQLKELEEVALKAMEEVETEKQRAEAIDQEIAEILSKKSEIEKSIQSDVAELDAGIQEHTKSREQLANSLDDELCGEYNKLFERYDGEAICDMEEKTCTGCNMGLTSNLIVRVLSGKEVVRCSSCGRILQKAPDEK